MANHFVHHEHHRHAEFFGQIERFDSQVKTFLRRIRAERDNLVIAMRTPPRLHHIGLRGQRGQASRRPSALHIDEYARRFGHGGVADMLHHQRKARPGGHGERLGSAPHRALQRDRSGQFVFHLNKRSAHGRHPRGEALNHFGGRSDGVSGGEAAAGSQRAFAAGMVAIHEVCAGEDAARVRRHTIGLVKISLHLSPPLAGSALVA